MKVSELTLKITMRAIIDNNKELIQSIMDSIEKSAREGKFAVAIPIKDIQNEVIDQVCCFLRKEGYDLYIKNEEDEQLEIYW